MAVQAQLYPENLGFLPICGLQDWMVNPLSPFEADFGFRFQEPQQGFFLLEQTQQNLAVDCHKVVCSSSSSSTCDNMRSSMPLVPQSLASQLEMQRQEIDYILHIQNERLRSALQEQRRQQLAVLLKSLESKSSWLMRQKEEDLAKATKKSMELEAWLRKAETESDSWQKLAKEYEAMVMDLSNTLKQIRERQILQVGNSAQDESSLCGSSSDREEEQVKEKEEEIKKMACKCCNSRSSCVLFLPCRHLCSCKSCEAFLGSCPVCSSAKEASMEVFWV